MIKKDLLIGFVAGCVTVFILGMIMKANEAPSRTTSSSASEKSFLSIALTNNIENIREKQQPLPEVSYLKPNHDNFPLTYREDEEPDVMFPTYRAFYRQYAAILNLSCDPRVKLLRFCADQNEIEAVQGLTSRDRILKLEYLNLLAEFLIGQVVVGGRSIVRALRSPRNQERLLNEPKSRGAFARFGRQRNPAKRFYAMGQSITSLKSGLIEVPELTPFALTMTYHGLESMRKILTIAKARGLPGHFLEAGVWRGGVSMFSRAALNLLYADLPDDEKPHVWVCDSFGGLPTVRSELSIGEEGYHDVKHIHGILSVPLEIVMHNFKSFGLYNRKNTHFAKGYFIDSLPIVRADLIKRGIKLSVLRADGDMYESTIDILYNLYDLVEVGGIIIVDDWSWGKAQWMARIAVEDFFEIHGLWEDHHMVDVDGSRAYFTKVRDVKVQKWRYDQSLELTKKYKEEEAANPGKKKPKSRGGFDPRFQKFPVRPFDDGLRSVDQKMHDERRVVWESKRAEIKAEENKLLEKYWFVDESDDFLS